MEISKTIFFILIITIFVAGVFWGGDILQFYYSLGNRINDFSKTDVGQTISQVGQKVFTPTPLNVGGNEKQVFLSSTKIISETNIQREQNGGLPALIENKELNKAALAKANDMFQNQYFEHVSPSGVNPGDLVKAYGYDFITTGENLILGNFSSEQEAVQDWMDSPGHRENILNDRYTEIGVAVIKGIYKDQIVWIGVQEFGLPASACSAPEYFLKDSIDSEQSQLSLFASQIDEKMKQITDTDSKSAAYKQMVNDYNQLVSQYNSLAEDLKKNISTYNEQVNNYNNCVQGI